MRPVRYARAQRYSVLRPVRQERGQTLKKKGEEYKKPPALRPAASTKALYRLCRTVPGRVPVSPVRPPVLDAFGRASRSAGSATSSYGHRDRLGGQSRDMGPVGRFSDVPGLRQAFPGPGGADPGYVEHRPVSGAGVRMLIAARCARFREFAPLRLARLTGTNRPSRHIWEMRRDVSGASRRRHICVPCNMDPA